MKYNKNKKLKGFSLIPSTIRRRVSPEDLEEAFQDSLDDAIESAYDSKSVFWRVRNSKRWWVFSKWVIDDMITLLEQEFFSDDNRVYFDDGDFYYEKIRKPLITYYKDRLEEAFYEILKNKNLMEEKKISMKKKSNYDPKKVVHKDDKHIVIDKDLDWEDEVKYDVDDVSYEDDDWMVIDLKEEDLTRIVKKVIKESDLDYWKDYAERKKETESQDNETKHILQVLDDETFVDDDENVYAPWIRTRFNVKALVSRTHILLAEAFVYYCMKKFKIKGAEAIKIWRKYVKESIFSKLGYDMSNYPNVNENTKDNIFKEEDLTRIVKKVLKEDTPPQPTKDEINTDVMLKTLANYLQKIVNKYRNQKGNNYKKIQKDPIHNLVLSGNYSGPNAILAYKDYLNNLDPKNVLRPGNPLGNTAPSNINKILAATNSKGYSKGHTLNFENLLTNITNNPTNRSNTIAQFTANINNEIAKLG